MTAESYARDPLASSAAELARASQRTAGRVTLEHMPFLAQVSLRLDPSLAGRTPYPLPLEPNTASEAGPRAVLWLGPDEWLVLGPPHTGPEIVEELETALAKDQEASLHRSVIEVSANRVAIELGGPDRHELLASGCPIDLYPASWRAGMCAQTLFARTQVILLERTHTTRVLVRPSFANYLIDRVLATI
ncbi:MAG: sarcosine oxidase subunit gamma family protein [Actinomycetota bacterium]